MLNASDEYRPSKEKTNAEKTISRCAAFFEVVMKVSEEHNQYGISADRIAAVVEFAVSLPEDTTVNEFTVGPANQPW